MNCPSLFMTDIHLHCHKLKKTNYKEKRQHFTETKHLELKKKPGK